MSDKFGLDYLINKGKRGGGGDVSSRNINVESREQSQQTRDTGSEEIERAAVSIGSKILEELRRRKSQGGVDTTSLKELVDAVGVEWDTLNFVCRRLQDLGLVEIVPDKYGDHAVRLTQTGEASLNISSL